MQLKKYQLSAVKSLFEAIDKPVRDIILKSPTGSGKTIILTYFMHQYVQSYRNTVFVWLTPGKGNLEEQSKEKMDKYIHAAQTKLLSEAPAHSKTAGGGPGFSRRPAAPRKSAGSGPGRRGGSCDG